MATGKRTPPRLLKVVRSLPISPQLSRITLTGDQLLGFPENSDGDHIKLMFPQSHQTQPVLPTLGEKGPIWPPKNEKPIVRTYSVSRFSAESQELDVDMVVHHDGPGSNWAAQVKPGDWVGLAGPGGPARIKNNADWYLLAADLSAYGAFEAALRSLPADARGYALLESDSEIENPSFGLPPGISYQRVAVGDRKANVQSPLEFKVRTLDWLEGTPSVMIAGENSRVLALRQFVVAQQQVPKSMVYAVPYWKFQFDEEGYHEERHRIMDEMDS